MSGSDGREIYRVVWPRGARTVQASNVAPKHTIMMRRTLQIEPPSLPVTLRIRVEASVMGIASPARRLAACPFVRDR